MKMQSIVLTTIAFTFMSGCLMTRSDVKEAEQRRTVQDQVITLQKTNAESTNRFEEYNSQLREIGGRVERLEAQQEQEFNQREKGKKSQDEAAGETVKTVNLLKEEMIKMQSQLAALSAQVQTLEASSAAKAATAPKDDGKDDKGTAYDAGEELFGKKDWKKAILSYQKYRESFPKGKRFADATYKIGVCFQELGMKTEAASFYDEVIAKFPASETAKKAKVRIKKVK